MARTTLITATALVLLLSTSLISAQGKTDDEHLARARSLAPGVWSDGQLDARELR